MKKKILSILILMSILVQSTGTILSKVVAVTTTNNEKVAKIDFFDTTAKINIDENTSNITSRDQGGRSQETTILDHNGNFNFIYYDDDNVYIQRLNSNMTVKDTLTIPKKYPKIKSPSIIVTGCNFVVLDIIIGCKKFPSKN